jgi:hypothetical protein
MARKDRLDQRTPFQIYRDARVNAVYSPDSHHASKVRDITFKELHNAAALFLLEQEGIDVTPESFKSMRSRVSAMVAEDLAHNEKNGNTPKLGPQLSNDPSKFYKRVGD